MGTVLYDHKDLDVRYSFGHVADNNRPTDPFRIKIKHHRHHVEQSD